jgi:type IV secretion system protein VirB10
MRRLDRLLRRADTPPDELPAKDGPPSAEAFQRSEAAVAGHRSSTGRLHSAIGLVLIGTLGISLLAWYYSTAFSRASEARESARKTTSKKADAESVLPPLQFARLPMPRYRIGSVLGSPTSDTPTPNGLTNQPPPEFLPPAGTKPKTPQELELDRELSGAVFARPANATAPALQPQEEGVDVAIAQSFKPSKAGDNLSGLLASAPVATVRASLLPTRRLLLPKGSFIDCTLETAMDSSLPGLTTCLTAVDTFGADGSVVLLERGTKLIGETRGEVARGASRIFVLWTEARTPLGVVVPLASPGTDELGRSGLPGQVNRHFWERFGAALLISLVDGTIQAAANSQAQSDSTIILNPNGSRDVTTEILRSSANIPPTVTKRQGDRIQILVARDLDFRSVYELRTAR